MHLFDFISAAECQPISPARFLANEEALLDYCESNEHPGFLSFWEPAEYFVVLGYGKQLATEVFEEECNRLDIPILRRASGGGTVLQGRGCFNYTLVLPISSAPQLESITGANRFIMEKNRAALAPLVAGGLEVRGHTDLTLEGLKFSGNAQRRKRRCLLFHGSLLLDFDLPMISRTLRVPPLQPEYRHGRAHADFLANLRLNSSVIRMALTKEWNATQKVHPNVLAEVRTRAATLEKEKYAQPEWNRRC